MTTWYTSDLHLGHKAICKYQPNRMQELGFNYVDEADVWAMNEAIVQRWNSVIAPEDTVWVLGDVAMGKIDESLPNVERLNGRKHLILGNHDRPHTIMSRGEKQAHWFRRYSNVGFETISYEVVTDINGIVFVMSHFPYEGDHVESGEERYKEWRPTDRGLPLVHGHVHDMYRTQGRMFNVGIDANGCDPVHEDTILEWLLSLS